MQDETWQVDVITSSYIDTTQYVPRCIIHSHAAHDEACQLWIQFFRRCHLDNLTKQMPRPKRIVWLFRFCGLRAPQCIFFLVFPSGSRHYRRFGVHSRWAFFSAFVFGDIITAQGERQVIRRCFFFVVRMTFLFLLCFTFLVPFCYPCI